MIPKPPRDEIGSRSTDRSLVVHEGANNPLEPFNATLGSQVSALRDEALSKRQQQLLLSQGKLVLAGETGGKKPPLVIQMESYIRKELHLLHQNGGGPMERLAIFSEAFANLAGHFREYTELFLSIKREYEDLVARGVHAVAENVHLTRELDTAKQCVQYIVDAETQKLDSVIRQLRLDLEQRTRELTSAKEQMTDLIREKVALERRLSEKDIELDDVNSRCKLASDALRNETERHITMASERKQYKKDAEKLQKYSRALEEKVQADQISFDSMTAQIQHVRLQLQIAQQQNAQLNEALLEREGEMEMSIRRSDIPASGLMSGDAGSPASVKAAPRSPRAVSLLDDEVAHDAQTVGSLRLRRSASVSADKSFLLMEPTRPGMTSAFIGLNSESSPEEMEDALIRAKDQNRKLRKELDEANRRVKAQATQLTDLRKKRVDRPQTPRPEWNSISDLLADFNPVPGEQSTTQIIEDLSDLLRDLISENRRENEVKAMSRHIFEWLGEHQLTESDLAQKRPKFIGLGTSPDIPPYLRFHGRIRNKQMQKGDAERMLQAFWHQRQMRRRAEGAEVMGLNDFLFDFLFTETKSNNGAIELAYNLFDVCRRNMQDPDCSMFIQIMEGQVSEDRLFDEIATVEQLRRVLEHEDVAKTGFLPRSSVHFTLKQFFSAKPHDNLLKIKFALLPFTKSDEPAQPVHYTGLFEEDTSGNQSRFVELIRQQHGEESTQFLIDIAEALREEISPTGMLQVNKIINTIKYLDPKLPLEDVRRVLAKGLSVRVEEADKIPETQLVIGEEFLSKIRYGVFVKRHSKPLHGGAEWSDEEGMESGTFSQEGSFRLE